MRNFLLRRIAEDHDHAQSLGPGDPGNPRMVAECKAKWRILEGHPNSLGQCVTCSDGDDGGCPDPDCCGGASAMMHSWPCPTLRAIAAIYADHPDYRDEWKP